MKTLTASTSTIVALDLGKYKSVACLYSRIIINRGTEFAPYL
jgi:hypothetical protein